MIPGNPNGQVWIAKEIRKVEPVARSSKLYPTRLDEYGVINAGLHSYFIKKTILLVNVEEVTSFSGAITGIVLTEFTIPPVTDTVAFTASITSIASVESPQILDSSTAALASSITEIRLIESPKINNVNDSTVLFTAAITNIQLV